jgi:hypothetical protein
VNLNNTEGKWSLPPTLQLSDELLEKSREQQKEWASRTASPFGQLSPREFARSRAVIEVEQYKARLESLDKEESPTDELRVKREETASQLAVSYATLGRFDLAAQVEPNEEKRAEYVDILEALSRDDDVDCDCSDPQGEIPVSRKSYDYVWSIEKGKEIYLVKCSKCKFKNARPDLPDDLVKLKAHRAKVQSSMKGLTVSEMMAKERAEGIKLGEVLK